MEPVNGESGRRTVRPRVATVWLGGCSGCHMSFLDMDERLLEVAQQVDLVFSPIADRKAFPEQVDLTLAEGAVVNEENLHFIQNVRRNTRLLVAFGDCAVTGNVPAIRNALGSPEAVLDRAYRDARLLNPRIPAADGIVPRLLDRVLPLHHVVKVDAWLPGCPPSPDLIHKLLLEALAGNVPSFAGQATFG
jgi:NAD-reducing hydrogenase small subunit